MAQIRIALADDHSLFRSGIVQIVETLLPEMEVKLEASNGKELLEKMSRQKIDLVLTDIQMPEMNGLELAKIIRRDFDSVIVVGLSLHGNLYHVKKMLENGARGYLTKTTDAQELANCLRKIWAGEMAFCSKTTELLMKSAMEKNKRDESLSERDLELLKMVFEEKSTEEISNALGISHRREQMLVQEIMEKLKVKSRIGLVKWVYENGLA